MRKFCLGLQKPIILSAPVVLHMVSHSIFTCTTLTPFLFPFCSTSLEEVERTGSRNKEEERRWRWRGPFSQLFLECFHFPPCWSSSSPCFLSSLPREVLRNKSRCLDPTTKAECIGVIQSLSIFVIPTLRIDLVFQGPFVDLNLQVFYIFSLFNGYPCTSIV